MNKSIPISPLLVNKDLYDYTRPVWEHPVIRKSLLEKGLFSVKGDYIFFEKLYENIYYKGK
jgi:hypothetical protein